MAALDLITLGWVLVITSLVLSVAVLLVNLGSPHGQGLSVWGWGLLLQALSYPAFGLRQWGYADLSIVISNGLSAGTIAMHLLAVIRFQQDRIRPPHPVLVWGPVLFIVLMSWGFLADHPSRNMWGSALLALQSMGLAWLAWGPGLRTPRERGRLLLVAGAALLSLSLWARFVHLGFYHAWLQGETVPSTTQSFNYLVVLIVLLLNTTGFLLMQKEHSEQQLSESERRHRQLIDAAAEGICVLHDGVLAFANRRFAAMTGLPATALIGQSIFPFIDPQDRAVAQANHQRRMAGEADDLRYAVRAITASGEHRWWDIGGVSISWHGRPATLNFITDITQRKAMEEEIQRLAFLDPLTELPNRRLLVDRLAVAIQAHRRSGQWGALMFVDLDRFKFVNDTYGHEAGDDLLREVANRLQACARGSDTVSRFGGDEFVLLYTELGRDATQAHQHCAQLAQKILFSLEAPFRLQVVDGQGVDQTIEHRASGSVGVAMFTGAASADEVLKAADNAMYEAKAAGRQAYRFAAPLPAPAVSS